MIGKLRRGIYLMLCTSFLGRTRADMHVTRQSSFTSKFREVHV